MNVVEFFFVQKIWYKLYQSRRGSVRRVYIRASPEVLWALANATHTMQPVHRHHPSFVHPQVQHLQSVPQYEQRTPEWYEVRQTLMTASNAGAALGMKPFASFEGDPRDDAIQQIVYRTFTGNIATRHGQKYEDMVRDRLCEIMGVRAREYGLIRHSDVRPPGEGYEWLAASPDGITDCGMMIEIKCPYRRQIKPMYIPDIYAAQMQVQMEVCDLDRCARFAYDCDGGH